MYKTGRSSLVILAGVDELLRWWRTRVPSGEAPRDFQVPYGIAGERLVYAGRSGARKKLDSLERANQVERFLVVDRSSRGVPSHPTNEAPTTLVLHAARLHVEMCLFQGCPCRGITR